MIKFVHFYQRTVGNRMIVNSTANNYPEGFCTVITCKVPRILKSRKKCFKWEKIL